MAVEIDRDLAAHLAATAPPHVRIVAADFLEIDLAGLAGGEAPVRVVGNLPYNVGAPILFRLFEWSAGGTAVRDATRDAAARGGRPDAGGPRHRRSTAS